VMNASQAAGFAALSSDPRSGRPGLSLRWSAGGKNG